MLYSPLTASALGIYCSQSFSHYQNCSRIKTNDQYFNGWVPEVRRQVSWKQPCFNIGCGYQSDPAAKSLGSNSGMTNVLVIHPIVLGPLHGYEHHRSWAGAQTTLQFNSATLRIHFPNPRTPKMQRWQVSMMLKGSNCHARFPVESTLFSAEGLREASQRL